LGEQIQQVLFRGAGYLQLPGVENELNLPLLLEDALSTYDEPNILKQA